jgi:hypothetical protein
MKFLKLIKILGRVIKEANRKMKYCKLRRVIKECSFIKL